MLLFKLIPSAIKSHIIFIYTGLFICFMLMLAGCSKKHDAVIDALTKPSTIDSSAITSGTAAGSNETGYNADDLVENASFTSTVSVTFGATVSISNPLAAGGVVITQTGANVVINSSIDAVEYKISGTTANGSVKIYSSKKFKLTLNGANITCSNGPAINIQSSKRVFFVLADGSTNTLTDGTTYATSTEDMKGTIFSEGQLVFSGTGSLTVKGNYKHAICSDDYIRIRSGNITVTGAVKDGIHTNSAFIADGGTVKITAGSDGIECEEGYAIINNGNLTLNGVEHGISASYEGTDNTIIPYININNGTLNITTTSGEGIESKNALTINNGTIIANTIDDGLNAATALNINGGSVYLASIGNDGMDSNGTITITGGKVIAIGSQAPESGIDCDARSLKITGGIVLGLGGTTSAPDVNASTIHSVIIGNGAANQIIHIEAAGGTEALTFLAPSPYSTLLFASAKLKAATAYTIYAGGSVAAGSTSFKGLYTSGSYTKGTQSGTFTTTNMVTQSGGTISTK